MYLQTVISSIANSPDREHLKLATAKLISEQFSACRQRIVFFDEEPEAFRMISNTRSAIGKHILNKHSPAHEGLVMSQSAWEARSPRHDHGHVMAGPIVGQGMVVGIVALTRERGDEPFTESDLLNLSAICAHLSTWKPASPAIEQLTERERQIAKLIGQGRTNSEIARTMHVTENGIKQALKRMFRKLQVSSRAALVAKLNT